jgi:hypothetical protein
MSLLAIKLIVTPLVVLAATLAARRTVRSPASVAQAAFCFGYAALARRGQRRRSSPERWPMALSRPCSSMPDYRPSPCFSPRS